MNINEFTKFSLSIGISPYDFFFFQISIVTVTKSFTLQGINFYILPIFLVSCLFTSSLFLFCHFFFLIEIDSEILIRTLYFNTSFVPLFPYIYFKNNDKNSINQCWLWAYLVAGSVVRTLHMMLGLLGHC